MDSSNKSYKFPCKATLPDVYLRFQNGEAFGFRGEALTFNNPDAHDSKLIILFNARFLHCNHLLAIISSPVEYRIKTKLWL